MSIETASVLMIIATILFIAIKNWVHNEPDYEERKLDATIKIQKKKIKMLMSNQFFQKTTDETIKIKKYRLISKQKEGYGLVYMVETFEEHRWEEYSSYLPYKICMDFIRLDEENLIKDGYIKVTE